MSDIEDTCVLRARGPASSLSTSDWGNGPATCLPHFPAGDPTDETKVTG
jgi:hypothetical protein